MDLVFQAKFRFTWLAMFYLLAERFSTAAKSRRNENIDCYVKKS